MKSSSHQWLARDQKDPYRKRAQKQKLPSRAFFKLKEMNEAHHFLKKGGIFLELGASPGGWSSYILSQTPARLIALDLQDIKLTHPHLTFIKDDMTDAEPFIKEHGVFFDGVLSDIAPNASGMADLDHIRQMALCHQAFKMARLYLKKGGFFLAKITQGTDLETFLQELTPFFATYKRLKPQSSRMQSREQYVLAHNFKGNSQKCEIVK